MNLTDHFIKNLYELSKSTFPEDVIHQAKRCLLDYLGVTFAGSEMLKEKSLLLLDIFENGSNTISVVGLNRKTGLNEAALLNGLSSHVAELDDGERFGMFHPGSVIFSALIPAAQKFNISGNQFLKAIITGYEAAIRMARALQPALKDKGFHGTGICGTIGAGIAIATALGFSQEQFKDTLSAAATTSSGLLKLIRDSSELKPFNVGNAAQSGLNAAMLVKAGFKGPDDVLDGTKGFLNAFTGKCDVNQLLEYNSEKPAIMRIYMKPYAACRHCHPAIEAAIIMKDKYDLKSDDINSVIVKTYRWAVEEHDHIIIKGVTAAKMSTPFSIAVAFEKGNVDINAFSSAWLNNEKVKSLTNRVKVISDDILTALVPKQRAAVVELHTKDNKCYIEMVNFPKGEPETALTTDEVKEKFLSLVSFANVEPLRSHNIIKYVLNIETDLNKLMQTI